jgi:hypothetical protein
VPEKNEDLRVTKKDEKQPYIYQKNERPSPSADACTDVRAKVHAPVKRQ